MGQIRVLIVEDEPLVAASLKRMLSKHDYHIVAIAHRKEIALHELKDKRPDIALLDINLGGEFSGIEIGAEIKRRFGIPFIYITAYSDRKTLEEVKKTQPSGYLVKPFDEPDVVANMEIALYNHAQSQKDQFPVPDWVVFNQKLVDPLSRREMEVLQLIFEGRTNQQISDQMFVSVNTVKSHLFRLYQKLEVTSRTEAIARTREIAYR